MAKNVMLASCRLGTCKLQNRTQNCVVKTCTYHRQTHTLSGTRPDHIPAANLTLDSESSSICSAHFFASTVNSSEHLSGPSPVTPSAKSSLNPINAPCFRSHGASTSCNNRRTDFSSCFTPSLSASLRWLCSPTAPRSRSIFAELHKSSSAPVCSAMLSFRSRKRIHL